jgi:two-component system, OmpR family, response regulator ChvI
MPYSYKSNAKKLSHILVVDDEWDITTVISKALTQKGFEVDAYGNPRTALSEFQPNHYDVALIDIRMPSMSGFELYHEIRKQDEQIKICFMTAFEIHLNEFKKVMPSCDAKSFIAKPFSVKKLVDTIAMMAET